MATGAIIAGGKARRLGGAAKGLTRIGGETLVDRGLILLRQLGLSPIIIGDPGGPYSGAPVYPDQIADRGPPGGLHAALHHGDGWVCVLAVDLPRIDAVTLRALAEHRGDQHGVIAEAGGRLQPLAGWWHTRALPPLDALLRAGNPGFRQIVAALDVTVVPMDPSPFANLNTPADLAALGLTLPV